MLKRVIFFWTYLERLFRGNELKEPVSSRFLVFRVISPLVACPRGNISSTFFFLSLLFFRTRDAECLRYIQLCTSFYKSLGLE